MHLEKELLEKEQILEELAKTRKAISDLESIVKAQQKELNKEDKRMNKKYRMEKEGEYYRIYALKDFGDVKKGGKGGLIEKEDNLSTTGDCWVYVKALAIDNSLITNNGKVYDNGKVWNNGKVIENGSVWGNAKIVDNATISGSGRALDKSIVNWNGHVTENGCVSANAVVSENAVVKGNSIVTGNGRVEGTAVLKGNSRFSGCGKVSEGVWEHSPLYIQGSHRNLINSKPGHITIGYVNKTFAEWESQLEAIAKKEAWSEAQLVEYKHYIELFKKFGK